MKITDDFVPVRDQLSKRLKNEEFEMDFTELLTREQLDFINASLKDFFIKNNATIEKTILRVHVATSPGFNERTIAHLYDINHNIYLKTVYGSLRIVPVHDSPWYKDDMYEINTFKEFYHYMMVEHFQSKLKYLKMTKPSEVNDDISAWIAESRHIYMEAYTQECIEEQKQTTTTI